jgi:uncharacterized protein
LAVVPRPGRVDLPPVRTAQRPGKTWKNGVPGILTGLDVLRGNAGPKLRLCAPRHMTAENTALRIDVADLLSQPTARRSAHIEVPVDGLTGGAAQVAGDDPVVLDLQLERVSEGIVVRGTIGARWRAACSLCLADLEQDMATDVSELFEPDPVEGDTYPLEGHVLDLEQLVRDTILLELPLAPTCEGIDRGPCASDLDVEREPPPPDPRWAALSELDL